MEELVSSETTSSTDDDVVRGRFPTHYVISEAASAGRFKVYDRVSGTCWALGSTELTVARQFDGVQTYRSISTELRGRISPAGLRAFESQLIHVGILDDNDSRIQQRARSWARYFAVFNRLDFGSFDPSRILDVVDRRASWLYRRTWVLLLSAVSMGIVALLGTRLSEFVSTVPITLQGWGLPVAGGGALGLLGGGGCGGFMPVGRPRAGVQSVPSRRTRSRHRATISDRVCLDGAGPGGVEQAEPAAAIGDCHRRAFRQSRVRSDRRSTMAVAHTRGAADGGRSYGLGRHSLCHSHTVADLQRRRLSSAYGYARLAEPAK